MRLQGLFHVAHCRPEELADAEAAGAVPRRHERRAAAVPRRAAHPRHALEKEIGRSGPRGPARRVPQLRPRAGPPLVGRDGGRERQEDLPHLLRGDGHGAVEDWQ